MRKLLLGLFGFAAIGLSAATVQSAQAQPYSPGYGYGYGYGHGPVTVQYRGPGYDRGYRYGPPRGYRGPPYGYRGPRPAYYRPAYAPPRCYTRMERAWNGWRWIQRPIRICR